MRPLAGLTILLLVLLCHPAGAANFAPVLLDARQTNQPLGPQLEYLIGEPQASFEEIASRPDSDWQANEKRTLEVGRVKQGAWVRFRVDNQSGRENWLLEIRWSMLDRVELRQFDPVAGVWSAPQISGDHIPPSRRALDHRYLLLPVALPVGGESHLYLHIASVERLILPMRLTQDQQLAKDERLMLTLLLMLFGGLLAMLLYNASLLIFTRDRSYFWYVCYLGSALAYELSINGIGHQYVWGEWEWLAPKAYGLFGSLTFLLITVFGRVFLNIPRYGGWVKRINTGLIAYWLAVICAILFYPPAIDWLGTQQSPLLSSVLGFASVGYLWYRGNRSARLFIIAWSVMFVATVIHLLALSGALPLNTLTLGIQALGVFIEFILLSIALAERINRERAERIEAQNNLLLSTRNLAHEREEKLRAQQRILELQRAANEELEARVRERTHALEQAKQELEKLNGELAALSVTDALTQLANRRHFDTVIAEEASRSKRTQMPLSLVLLDIDHFKHINDTYGHPFGDECLRQVSQVIRCYAQRAGDLAARYGGEEFALVLPVTDIEQASVLAEQIRSAIEALQLAYQGKPVPVTASLGVSTLAFGLQDTPAQLIEAADSALYRAKRNGRNQIATESLVPVA